MPMETSRTHLSKRVKRREEDAYDEVPLSPEVAASVERAATEFRDALRRRLDGNKAAANGHKNLDAQA
jgi:hypothetical protein